MFRSCLRRWGLNLYENYYKLHLQKCHHHAVIPLDLFLRSWSVAAAVAARSPVGKLLSRTGGLFECQAG